MKSDKINVLFVIMQMYMGGAERLVHTLANKLDRTIFNPSVAWFVGDNILKEFSDLGIPLYKVPKTRSFDFSTMKKLADIIRDNDIHIVNAHHFLPVVYSFYGCKIANSRKLLYTNHARWEVEQVPLKWRILGGFLLRRSDGLIGVSRDAMNAAKDKFGLDPSKTNVIFNGVDIDVFNHENKNSNILRNSLGIKDNEKTIGIVANLTAVKNHIFLLKVFNELVKSHKNVKLLLIGQGIKGDAGNTEIKIKKFVNENGLNNNVLFLGYRSDIPDLLNILDIFCLISFREGLPISLTEAMAAGLPVVGTDVEGIRDVIIRDKNGFLVRLDDVEGLKKALCALIEDGRLRKKMGNESRTLAVNSYSLKENIKKYQDLFLSLMKNCY